MSVTIVSDTRFTAIVAFALGENWHTPKQRAEAQRIADCLKSMNVDAYNEVNMDHPGIDERPCSLAAGQAQRRDIAFCSGSIKIIGETCKKSGLPHLYTTKSQTHIENTTKVFLCHY